MEGGRAKRQKVDKTNKFAAFQKLKDLKDQGVKNKYEFTADENVYEEVSEREYTDRVLKRQEDDWIDDDGGDGYVEDGREIFDDDIEDVPQDKEKGKKKKNKNVQKPDAKKGDIQKLLANMPTKKKKKEDVQLNNDDVLADLLSEVNTTVAPTLKLNTKTNQIVQPKPEPPQTSAKEYLANFSKPIRVEKPVEKKPLKRESSPPITKHAAKIQKSEEKTVEVEVKEEPVDDGLWEQMQIDDWDPSQKTEEIHEQTKAELQIETIDSQTIEDNVKSDVKSTVVDSEFDVEMELPTDPIPEKKEIKCSEWESVQTEPTTSEPQVQSRPVDDTLPLVTDHEDKKVFRMYYLDTFEDIYKQPGTVYLFGKVFVKETNAHVSCCVIVQNIERKIYLLPRSKHLQTQEPISIADVYAEFDELATQYKILDFKSRKIEKKYAFNLPGIPDLSDYLEVRYSAKCPALPSDLTGNTFSHVFGTKTSFLENLLLEQKIKGPSWLEFPEAEKFPSRISWCKYEVLCNNMDTIRVSQVEGLVPPPLVVASINVQTVTNAQKQNEIIAIGCLINTSFPINKAPPANPFNQHFCVINKPSDMSWPYDNKEIVTNRNANTTVEKINSERALLNFFLTKLSNIDPDLIVGHDILNFDIEVLLSRMNAHKVPQWSRLCRIRRGNELMGLKVRGASAMSGRLLCDIKVSAMELIRARSYDLETLCQQVLHIKHEVKTEFSTLEVREMFKNSRSIVEFIKFTMLHASYIIKIMCELNVLPLAIQITNICGNVLSRTLMGGRSERNEFLLLHAFHEKSYLLPDKSYGKDKKNEANKKEGEGGVEANKGKRKKAAYSGGLVLEPKKGFYDKFIILMDFNSLYPSIIQEYNICFTTLPVRMLHDTDIMTMTEYLPDQQVETGILPSEIKKLVESRRQVKSMMKTPNLSQDLLMQYDIRQKALKLTANSMYGCLGFPNSRFFAQPLAALVTAKGREILLNTKSLVENLNYEVIYGDTDSLMISCNVTDYDSVFKIGNQIKSECNKLYKQLELDIDGVYKYMLLLKKKKYAALSISKQANGKMICTQEIKGVDVVRRDWSQLASEAGKFVISQILDEASYNDYTLDDRLQNIHEHMKKIRIDLDNGAVPLSLLEITKQLTKAPEEYTDRKALAHVQVALRLNLTNNKKLKQGDTISYIICMDGTNEAATQRAYNIEELKQNKELKIDINYYLSQQIHPVVTRLLEPIEGTDAVRIAECLGLDTTLYRSQIKESIQQSEENILGVGEAEEVKYHFCDKFEFICMNPACKQVNIIESPTRQSDHGVVFVLDECVNSDCKVPPYSYLPHLINKLSQDMNKYIVKYYEGWLKCEDPGCTEQTRRCPLGLKTRLCTSCHKYKLHRVYTELQLYQQLSFFHYICDITKALTKTETPGLKFDSETYLGYCKIKQHVERFLESSAYNVVDLKKLFSNEEKQVKISRGKEREVVSNEGDEEYEFDFDLEYSDIS
uniref:DNA polymerase n=1 Tax=Cacopsylla melanoneura TaxID=428564 RepID=A0A8D8V3S0_9HEMI